jgi:hypothetical protein
MGWFHPGVGYGGFAGLRLPACGKMAWKLTGGGFGCTDVTITDLCDDTGAAPPGGRPDEGAGLCGEQVRRDE